MDQHNQQGEPAHTADASDSAAKATGPVQPRRGAGAVSWIALFIALGAIGGGFYGYRYMVQPELASLSQRLDEIRGEVRQRKEERTNRLDALRQRVERLDSGLELNQQQVSQLQQSLDVVRSEAHWTRREWRLAEIRHLVQIAKDRLELMQDRDTAQTALNGALGRLSALSDPGLEPLRQRLLHDVQRIAIDDGEDSLEVIARLEAQVAKLRPYPREPVPSPKPQTAAPAGDTDDKSMLSRLTAVLGDRIRVVRHDEPLDMLDGHRVAAQQLELLKMRLLALRLAVAQKNRAFFEYELEGIRFWLESNPLGEDAEELIHEVKRLQEMNPFQAPPSLDPTLELIDRLLSRPAAAASATPVQGHEQ